MMVILSAKALLEMTKIVEDDITFLQGTIIYYDGERLDVGRVKYGEGNFLYDSKYVYRWRIDKEYPEVYDIEKREKEISSEDSKKLINRYKKYI